MDTFQNSYTHPLSHREGAKGQVAFTKAADHASAKISTEKGTLIVLFSVDENGFPVVDITRPPGVPVAVQEYNKIDKTLDPITPAEEGYSFNKPESLIHVTLYEE